MKIHLVCLRKTTYDAMRELQEQSVPQLHTLVEDPESADIILFVGRWSYYGHDVADSPLTKRYPEKCFAYCDNDSFAALLPGIYASVEAPRIFRLGRIKSQLFVDFPNPNVHPMEAEKKYLFSFAGRSTAVVRKRLYNMKFTRPDVLIENSSSYNHWDLNQTDREERQRKFARTIAESHFVLCPRGASAGSYRLFEVMRMGVAPVIISDGVLMPEGPDWDRFAIRVAEKDIAKLETILEKHVGESAERGRLALEAYNEWFAAPVAFNHLIAICVEMRAKRRIPERWIQMFWGPMLWRLRFKSKARDAARAAVLGAFRLLGKKFPYELDPDQGGRLGKY